MALLSTGLGLALVTAICCLVKIRYRPLDTHIISRYLTGPIISFISHLTQFLKIRIPRTKSEIEANFKRKKLLGEFNSKMRQLNTTDLDDMTYRLIQYKEYLIFQYLPC